jgi:hypothetical protein
MSRNGFWKIAAGETAPGGMLLLVSPHSRRSGILKGDYEREPAATAGFG